MSEDRSATSKVKAGPPETSGWGGGNGGDSLRLLEGGVGRGGGRSASKGDSPQWNWSRLLWDAALNGELRLLSVVIFRRFLSCVLNKTMGYVHYGPGVWHLQYRSPCVQLLAPPL